MNFFYISLSIFILFSFKKKKNSAAGLLLVLVLSCCRRSVPVVGDCKSMEKGQYGQHVAGGNPNSYMCMRDYINQSWQSQQPVERNPNEYRSMKDYGSQWMSSPYGSAYNHSWGNHTKSSWELRPPQYAPPEPPFYASTPQSPQPPQSIPPFEQAILDLIRIVDDFVEENKEINAHSIVTMEDNLNKKIDGLKDDFEHKWDNLQDSIENLINQQQCPPEEECQSDIMAAEQCEQQPHQELIEDFIELSEGLAESLDICDVVFPKENKSSGSAQKECLSTNSHRIESHCHYPSH